MYKRVYNLNEIIYSVVMPIYNQEDIIVENLKSIIENTLGNFEIILILDFCFDATEKNLMAFLENYKNAPNNFIQITIFKNSDKPLFETKCDNIGFKYASGKYSLEIQADMKMTERGYNLQLTRPFKIYDNVIAVSGRCAHNLSNSEGIGKIDGNIDKSIADLDVSRDLFYVFETCNRGPLLIDNEKLKELNYLDEDEYFLDNSEHDLMVRAYLEKRYICGYVAMDFHAPLHLGSMRNGKTYNNCEKYLINKNEKARLEEICNNKPGLSKYIGLLNNREPFACDIKSVSLDY